MNALTQEKKKKEVVASAPTTSTQKFDVNKWSFVKVRKWKADSSSEIGCILWKIYKRSIQWHFHHIVLHCVTLCSLKASTVNMIYFLHFTFWSFLQYSLGIWGLVGPARSPRAQKAKVLCAAKTSPTSPKLHSIDDLDVMSLWPLSVDLISSITTQVFGAVFNFNTLY